MVLPPELVNNLYFFVLSKKTQVEKGLTATLATSLRFSQDQKNFLLE